MAQRAFGSAIVLVVAVLSGCTGTAAETRETIGPDSTTTRPLETRETIGPRSTTTRPWEPGVVQHSDCHVALFAGDCFDGFRLNGSNFRLECELIRPGLVGDLFGVDGPVEYPEVRVIDAVEPTVAVAVRAPVCGDSWVAALVDSGSDEFARDQRIICDVVDTPDPTWSCPE